MGEGGGGGGGHYCWLGGCRQVFNNVKRKEEKVTIREGGREGGRERRYKTKGRGGRGEGGR